MMSQVNSSNGIPNHDFFNDAPHNDDSTQYSRDEITSKLKRTACVLCRKRKLKCDAARPKCATCARLGHECEYNEVRKKSGPKRGYVKALEARLSQVETQLKSAGGSSATNTSQTSGPSPNTLDVDMPQRSIRSPNTPAAPVDIRFEAATRTTPDSVLKNVQPPAPSWDMISLGLEEPLPTQDIQDELHAIYFRRIHPIVPMMHKARFYAALNHAPHARPPICLRYAMWTLACGASDAFRDMQPHFYRRAHKYLELDEMRAWGEGIMSVWQCQTSVLLSIFEFQNMHFPRAWLSTGRAVRLSQMLGLQRLDGTGLEVKRCIPPPADWTEKEERKRTFWMVFWEDRCASIGTGWPMSLDEQDIMTNLPASEDAFQNSRPEEGPSLNAALQGRATNISAFAGAIMLTALFGRNLLHLHRPTENEREYDLNGTFWKRHRSMDNNLLNISLNLPNHLRIPEGLPDPNVIFMNMCIHTSVICLHQAAIFKVDRNRLPVNIGQESKIRCVTAAAEIANIMRSISHCDLGMLNPFSAFCLYVAARVFVQYLKSRREDQQILGSLHFLLSAMHALKRKNPLAESFLAQLDVDLEGANIPTTHTSSIEALKKKGFKPHCVVDKKNRAGQPTSSIEVASDIVMTTGRDGFNVRKSNDKLGPFPTQCAKSGGPKGMLPEGLAWNENQRTSQEPTSNVAAPIPGTQKPELFIPFPHHTDTPPGGIWNESESNSRQNSVEQMDLSPVISGSHSTLSLHTNRSTSSGQTAYTPPQSDNSATDQQTNKPSFFSPQVGNVHEVEGYDDNQPVGLVAFKDYPLATSNPDDSADFSMDGVSSMTHQEFDNLTKSLFPATPGGGLDSWSLPLTEGMTPGLGEDWSQILDSMSGGWNEQAQATPHWQS